MIVIDGSILVSPYFATIVKDVRATEIVVPRRFKRQLAGADQTWAALIDFYGADADIAWKTLHAAESHVEDWVKDDHDGLARLADAGDSLRRELYAAFSRSSSDRAPEVYSFVAEELAQAIGLQAPILAIGDPRPATWSLLENAFGEQCTIPDLSSEGKRKRLQELNVSFAAIAGLDLCLIEVIAPQPLVWQQMGPAAMSHCRFVALDP